jgi:predicted metalloprotease with PDZ domain
MYVLLRKILFLTNFPILILATDTRTPSIMTREQPNPPIFSSFGQKNSSSVLEDLTNNNPLLPSITSSVSTSFQPREVPLRKASTGVGFNFRTIPNDSSSDTPFSHIVTSVDNTNSIGSQGLRVNDYILSINDENVEYLNHEQLEDKLRRINNSETIRLLVADGNVYRAYKDSSKNQRIKNDFIEQPKVITPNTTLQQNRRQYRLQRNPDFEGYGFRVRSNHQADGTPHQIVSVEPYSPADSQGLRVGDYILRVNNQTVEHMNPTDFNRLMQNLVRNDNTRDGTLLLEVMDENTYRSLNQLPAIDTLIVDRRTPSRPVYDPYQQSSVTDEPYPRIRQCFIRVKRNTFIFCNFL